MAPEHRQAVPAFFTSSSWLAYAWFLCLATVPAFAGDHEDTGFQKKQSYRRLEFIGLALIFLQLVCIGLAYTEPYTHSYQVAFQSNIEDYRTPITMIANAMNPFNLYWFILGCVIFILARGFQFGNQLQLQQDQTI